MGAILCDVIFLETQFPSVKRLLQKKEKFLMPYQKKKKVKCDSMKEIVIIRQ